MTRTKNTIAMIGIWLGLLLTSACNASTPTSTPTADLNPLRTEVASTVLAQVTRDLALTPSATPIPSPTVTPVPSLTATSGQLHLGPAGHYFNRPGGNISQRDARDANR